MRRTCYESFSDWIRNSELVRTTLPSSSLLPSLHLIL